MKTPVLYLMCGLSFSGKTTLAKQIAERTGAAYVAYDHLWGAAIPPLEPPLPGWDDWLLVRKLARTCVAELLRAGRSVVYDDLNLEREDRADFRRVARAGGAECVVVYLETPIEVVLERRALNDRERARGETTLEKLRFDAAKLEPPGARERTVVVRPEDDLDVVLGAL